MREYMISLGSVIMMISVANILIPGGSIKKFTSLAMGFMVISAVVTPIGTSLTKFEFSKEAFMLDTQAIEEAEKKYREDVLERHSENLANKIKEHIRHGSEVCASVDNEGNLAEVTIEAKGDESLAVAYIVETLKLPRERIKLKYENN